MHNREFFQYDSIIQLSIQTKFTLYSSTNKQKIESAADLKTRFYSSDMAINTTILMINMKCSLRSKYKLESLKGIKPNASQILLGSAMYAGRMSHTNPVKLPSFPQVSPSSEVSERSWDLFPLGTQIFS